MLGVARPNLETLTPDPIANSSYRDPLPSAVESLASGVVPENMSTVTAVAWVLVALSSRVFAFPTRKHVSVQGAWVRAH